MTTIPLAHFGGHAMNRNLILASILLVAGASSRNAAADLLLFDLETQRGEWIDALKRNVKHLKGAFDLGSLADFGLEVMDGPLTFEGNASGSVPFGFIPNNIALDSNLSPFGSGGPNGRGVGGSGLLGIGPSAGFGNPSNAIVSNFAEDSFDVLVTRPFKTAMSFHALSLSGSDVIDMTVYDLQDRILGQFSGLDAPAIGHEYGIILTEFGRFLGRVNLYDGSNGKEGILGEAKFYDGEVPTPAAWPVALLLSLIARRRRDLH